jgi:hypothetical protein
MYEQQLKVQNFSFVQDHWLDKSHELRGKKKKKYLLLCLSIHLY